VPIVIALAVLALLVAACASASRSPAASSPSPSRSPSSSHTPPSAGLRYVAFGDSYTIGTALTDPAGRFPDQLVAGLGPEPPTLTLVANLGVNGYTSADLIRRELPALDDLAPTFATVLIGVNDVVQGVPADRYEANVVTILDALLAYLPRDRIVTIAIPDYTMTPAGADFGDPRQQHDGIVANNATMARLSADRGIAYVDTFDISLRAADDRSLVADDGLHPSAIQYGRWVERISPVVEMLLGR
jgi:acyl-CoA thioesterase I